LCQRLLADALLRNGAAVAFPDGVPLTDGHTLIVPRRHVASIFELAPDELVGLWQLVAEVRARLSGELRPDGFTVGINDGRAAGEDNRPRTRSRHSAPCGRCPGPTWGSALGNPAESALIGQRRTSAWDGLARAPGAISPADPAVAW